LFEERWVMASGSIRFRLIALWVVFLIITLQSASVGMQYLFERSVMRRTLSELTLDGALLAEAIEVDGKGDVTASSAPTDPLFSVVYGGRYWQVTRAGEALLRSPSLWGFKLQAPADGQQTSEPTTVRLTGPNDQALIGVVRQVGVETGLDRRQLAVVVAADLDEIAKATLRFAGELQLGMALLAGLLLMGASTQVVFGLRPLRDIQARLAQVRSGEIRRLEGRFPVEVMPLVAETNALLDAQDAALDVARTRAGDLAHGLKTPLAVMATQSRALRRRGDSDIAEHLDAQIEVMRRHVERELARARVRGGGGTHHVRFDTSSAIRNLVGVMQLLPKGQELTWRLALTDPLLLNVDRADFDELMGNLVDNAHKWARSTVLIESRILHEQAEFRVEDDGPGIADTDVDRILQRGERADMSVAGTGLGLAISKDLVTAYRGTLEITRGRLGGLAAIVTLALKPDQFAAINRAI
jgi:signal transduction histidine kinase